MYTEIEAKLKVDSLEQVRRKLVEVGAEFVEERRQVDDHFDDAEGRLRRSGRAFRLRRQVVRGEERFFLTFKGPKQRSNLKKRQEVEVEVEDGDSARKLLSALGYETVVVVEKRRQLWRLGECEVCLDRLPLLGEYVEIEGPGEQEIVDVQRRLGLSGLRHIPRSYSALVRAKLSELAR